MGILDRTLAAARSLLAPEPAPLQRAADVVDDPNAMFGSTRGIMGDLWFSTSAMYNAVTGIGTSKDPSYYNAWAIARPLQRSELYGMGRNALIVQALSKLPNTATREGWVVNITDPTVENAGEISDKIAAYEQRLGSGQACARSMVKGRQYGDAFVLLGIDDGRPFSEPVDTANIKTVKWTAVIDSRSFQPYSIFQADDENFGKVERFLITDINGVLEDGLRYGPNSVSFQVDELNIASAQQGGQLLVHADRVLHFPTADYLPLLETLQDSLGAFFEAMNGIRTGARESSTVIYGIKNWVRKAWSENSGLAKLHMAFVDRAKSAMNAWVIDKDDESVQIANRSLSGLSQLADPFMVWLAAALAIPVTVLWGVSPGGFGKGEAERETWHEEVRAFQSGVLARQLRKLHGYILAAQDGCMLPADTQREIIFSDLSPPNEETRSELRNSALMEIRQLYKDDVITRDEARKAAATLADDYFRLELGELATKKPPAPVGLITGGTALLQAAYPEGIPLDAVRGFLKSVAADYFDDLNILNVVPERATAPTSAPALPGAIPTDEEDDSEDTDGFESLWSTAAPPADANTAPKLVATGQLPSYVTSLTITNAAKARHFPTYKSLHAKPRPLYSLREVKQAILSVNEASPAVDHGPRSLCIALRLPPEFARFVPYKAEDTSPPHVTLVYVDDVDPRDFDALLSELHATFADIEPFTVAHSGDVAYFDTPAVTAKAQRVAYAVTQFSTNEQALFAELADAIESFGLSVQRHGDEFTPHTTLAYLQTVDETYVGSVPKGTWSAVEAEVWYDGESYPISLQGDYTNDVQIAVAHDKDTTGLTTQTGWIWRTQRDGRVRKQHARLEGKRFKFGDAPDEGEPGQAPNCRCAKEIIVPPGSTKRAQLAAQRTVRRALRLRYKQVTGEAIKRQAAAARDVDTFDAATWTDAVRNLPDDAKEERIAEAYKRYHETVNMGATELREWAATEWSKQASVDRSPIDRNLTLLETPHEQWTLAHASSALRTVNFVSRMRGNEQGEPVKVDGRTGPSKRDISLKNWAFDPNK
jgi:phage-related protein (TIGR01555 family)